MSTMSNLQDPLMWLPLLTQFTGLFNAANERDDQVNNPIINSMMNNLLMDYNQRMAGQGPRNYGTALGVGANGQPLSMAQYNLQQNMRAQNAGAQNAANAGQAYDQFRNQLNAGKFTAGMPGQSTPVGVGAPAPQPAPQPQSAPKPQALGGGMSGSTKPGFIPNAQAPVAQGPVPGAGGNPGAMPGYQAPTLQGWAPQSYQAVPLMTVDPVTDIGQMAEQAFTRQENEGFFDNAIGGFGETLDNLLAPVTGFDRDNRGVLELLGTGVGDVADFAVDQVRNIGERIGEVFSNGAERRAERREERQARRDSRVKGSYAMGTTSVPETGTYQLHQGEAVVPKSLNPAAQAPGVAGAPMDFTANLQPGMSGQVQSGMFRQGSDLINKEAAAAQRNARAAAARGGQINSGNFRREMMDSDLARQGRLAELQQNIAFQADQRRFSENLAASQFGLQQELGRGNLGVAQTNANTAANTAAWNYELGQGQNQIGQMNANTAANTAAWNYELGQGQNQIGQMNANTASNAALWNWQAAQNQHALGMGQLGLDRQLGTGRLALDQSTAAGQLDVQRQQAATDYQNMLNQYLLGQGGLANQATQISNDYTLGQGGLDVQRQQAATDYQNMLNQYLLGQGGLANQATQISNDYTLGQGNLALDQQLGLGRLNLDTQLGLWGMRNQEAQIGNEYELGLGGLDVQRQQAGTDYQNMLNQYLLGQGRLNLDSLGQQDQSALNWANYNSGLDQRVIENDMAWEQTQWLRDMALMSMGANQSGATYEPKSWAWWGGV